MIYVGSTTPKCTPVRTSELCGRWLKVKFQSSNLQAGKSWSHNLKKSQAFIFCSLWSETVGDVGEGLTEEI